MIARTDDLMVQHLCINSYMCIIDYNEQRHQCISYRTSVCRYTIDIK